jgi:hypothetical protein
VEVKRLVADRMKVSLDSLSASLPKSQFLAGAQVGKTAIISGLIIAAVPAALGVPGAQLTLPALIALLFGGAYEAWAAVQPADQSRIARQAHYVAMLG